MRDLTLTRTFHPVGQGAFYSEILTSANSRKEFRIVYDCGSTSKKTVEKEILSSFAATNDNSGKTVIDILFISHFDYDHISGIEKLKDVCEIKMVVMPLLTEENRDYILTEYCQSDYCSSEDDLIFPWMLLNAPEEVFKNGKIVYVVDNFDNEMRRYDKEQYEYLDDSKCLDEVGNLINSKLYPGCIVLNDIWIYKPFNHNPSVRDCFIHELTANGIEPDELYRIDYLWSKKDVLKSIPKCRNINSMLLYSGSINHYVSSLYIPRMALPCRFSDYCIHYKVIREGCLYLGDSSANSLKEFYSKNHDIIANISTIQIAHHGSNRSYNECLMQKLHFKYGVISYGTENKYGHPGTKVIESLTRSGKQVIDVTEKRDTACVFVFNLNKE